MNSEVKIIDGVPRRIVSLVVHDFKIFDHNADPDIAAADPLIKWEDSEAGKWVMEHALHSPAWHRMYTIDDFVYSYIIIADLFEEDAIYFNLKWK